MGGPHGSGGEHGGLGARGLSGLGGFAPGAESDHRYSLTFSVMGHNLLNKANFAPPVGNLDSPIFGQPNALYGAPYSFGSANRHIDLQMIFAF